MAIKEFQLARLWMGVQNTLVILVKCGGPKVRNLVRDTRNSIRDTDMRTKDGVEFKMGMTLVNDQAREFHITEDEWYVKTYASCIWLYHKNSGMKLLVDSLYSSNPARIYFQVQQIQRAKDMLENEVYDLTMGRYPSDVFFKARNHFSFVGGN